MENSTGKKNTEGKYNVLIVDDEASVRHLIECLLKEMEYNIHHASNGAEALEFLKKTSVDLIILDLLLPGKHGLNVCSKIREIDKLRNTPILIITAVYTKSKYNYQSREYGANAFMTKPFDNEAFIAQVSRLVEANKVQEICLEKQE